MTTGNSTTNQSRQGPSNLAVRAITALILGPIVLLLVFIGGWAFVVLVVALAVVSMLEFYELGRGRDIPGNVLIGLVSLVALLILFNAGQYILRLALFLLAGIVVYMVETLRGTMP